MDEGIFYKEEMEHTEEEKAAQLQLHDALIGGFHGIRHEKWTPEYIFRLETRSRHGWVTHASIYAWLKTYAAMDMTLEVFWNIVLHTRGDKDKEHSYK
eukprot:874598-Heterocapsa_arctica.AAC.1